MIVGVPRETFPGERRVALVPAVVPMVVRLGLEVLVEAGAGQEAGFHDPDFLAQGARLAADRDDLFHQADILLQVRTPGANPTAGPADLDRLHAGQIVIGLADPLQALPMVQALAERGVTLLALELIPRVARAQSMDVLSSMATIAGYQAVLLAAAASPRLFPLLMTAAGTLAPARVFVIGAGVAGLQAIATARRLGAVVQAYDVRPAVREQVESLGARFVQIALEHGQAEDPAGYARDLGEEFYSRQRRLLREVLAVSDVVITTALVPGHKPPRLITGDMVQAMSPGSVIVDLAAERGGNCEWTRPGHPVVRHGVTILGPVNLPSLKPYHASLMYARNAAHFLAHLLEDGRPRLDAPDAIIGPTLVTRAGQVVHPRLRALLGRDAPAASGGSP